MSDLVIDYSRADAERRMKLLEMASGDLKRAMELEQWVQSGSSVRIVAKGKLPETADGAVGDDDLQLPHFLVRTPLPHA